MGNGADGGAVAVGAIRENGTVATNRNASLGDMIRSILVIGALILALAGVGYWFQVKPDRTTPAVDYVAAAEAARGVADFDLLIPASLPAGWKATTVRYEGGAGGQWHLGVLTDKGAYIGLEQSRLGRQRSLEKFAPHTTAKGERQVGGFDWQLRQSKGGETTLVRESDGITILVTGTAAKPVIEAYAATLSSR